jgi:hypothetical protein
LPEVAWCTAWVFFQYAKGKRVMTPSVAPSQRLARPLLKNEPWPQSCWKMNSRTYSPAVGSASNSVHA